MSGWTYNNIRIVVQEMNDADKQNISRLQPVVGGTVLQIFGYEDTVKSVAGYVVGDTDLEALRALKTTGLGYTLRGYGQSYDNMYLSSCKANRLNILSQTIRPDLDCASPVYYVELELYE